MPTPNVESGIYWSITSTSIGHVLVATTRIGVTRVSISADPGTAVQQLTSDPQWRAAQRDDEALGSTMAVIHTIVAGTDAIELPTDVHATTFQGLVWNHLRTIPRGQTRTYSDVARAIGRPSAVRAVARACATNPTALVVPCHRVIRSDGTLAGYRWGIEAKRRLLLAEQG